MASASEDSTRAEQTPQRRSPPPASTAAAAAGFRSVPHEFLPDFT